MPGCKKSTKSTDTMAENDAHTERIVEARLTDIPLPLHSKCITRFDASHEIEMNTSSNTGVQLFYTNKFFDLVAVTRFYVEQMELNGWHAYAKSEGEQTVLIFQKPTRVCTILVRSVKNAVEIALFIMPSPTA
jgi:hypothetical protein